ncbi:PAS domain-containing methyl-accepting chemotaxis protein [Halobacteriovorax sp. GB3]|uniref:methyl-accepting chemotaxis protein n=1 Tax=Halobacteriovorax sp. GB3 TaxID=2719615 RepID=UPI002360948A|nr:PAS domain-containing methyl-accepting chemotaxis protein [Halobacteriovorax sp. GB3]MDD0854151.1 PAS domain-containing methyl-accepting chemotaxis protein [Halobacteriovorax sp. GB3]
MSQLLNTNNINSENEINGLLKALDRVQAIIEFDLEGNIITANDNFLSAMGYELSEVQGKHHKIFCDPQYAQSLEYKNFWKRLGEGEFNTGEFERFNKKGESIWINASYNPIFDISGKVEKVVKFATDVTEEKLRTAEFEGMINAISKSQAVIEFDLKGNILTANENFLKAMGYKLDEIIGKHHAIFCDPEYTKTSEYQAFWQKLGRGEFDAGDYKRVGKNGNEIWIHASYNPIYDMSGSPFKVVKFATDITEQKIRNADFKGQLEAIDKSQAVIEFNLDGTIIHANSNFLGAIGYTLAEIKGKHHRMFCDPEYANSADYMNFWKKLGQGEFDAGEYKRIGKNGKEIWINASYNPILDVNGNVYKVVKYATDLTKEKEAYNNLVNSFADAVEKISSSSTEITNTANEMSSDASKTLEISKVAARNSSDVSNGVQNVSASTEELSASIQELTKSSFEASQFSTEATQKTQEAGDIINELGDASEDIGAVIKVISEIAQQTNLLALNATIEAARAGESGKGFAVVASEVKELAKQTAHATESISQKIGNVQEKTKSVVVGVEEVKTIIEKLNAIAGTTASAVEEQSATTKEVSKILFDSNSGVKKISDILTEVEHSADKSADGAKGMLNLAENLNDLSIDLKMLVDNARLK